MFNPEKNVKRKQRKRERLKRELRKVKSSISFLGLISLTFFKKLKIVVPQFSFVLNYKNVFIAFDFNHSKCNIYYPMSISDYIDSQPVFRKLLFNFQLVFTPHNDNDNSLGFVLKFLKHD